MHEPVFPTVIPNYLWRHYQSWLRPYVHTKTETIALSLSLLKPSRLNEPRRRFCCWRIYDIIGGGESRHLGLRAEWVDHQLTTDFLSSSDYDRWSLILLAFLLLPSVYLCITYTYEVVVGPWWPGHVPQNGSSEPLRDPFTPKGKGRRLLIPLTRLATPSAPYHLHNPGI